MFFIVAVIICIFFSPQNDELEVCRTFMDTDHKFLRLNQTVTSLSRYSFTLHQCVHWNETFSGGKKDWKCVCVADTQTQNLCLSQAGALSHLSTKSKNPEFGNWSGTLF